MMKTIVLWGAGLVLCSVLGCSKESETGAPPPAGGGAPPAGAAGATAEGGMPAGGVAATGGAAGTAGAGSADCGEVSLTPKVVIRTGLSAGIPAATSGTVVDGVYDLVRSEQEGASPDAGTRMSFEVKDNGLRFDAIRQVASGAEERASYTARYEDGLIIITQRCPAKGLGEFQGYKYSATASRLTLIREDFFLEFERRM